ncbi:MAG: hypothetical protein AB9M53_07920 [Leptothrix sp. (in: b-proteobacteria)]
MAGRHPTITLIGEVHGPLKPKALTARSRTQVTPGRRLQGRVRRTVCTIERPPRLCAPEQ